MLALSLTHFPARDVRRHVLPVPAVAGSWLPARSLLRNRATRHAIDTPSIPWTTGPDPHIPPPPLALSPARHPMRAARARHTISLGRSRRPRYSGSTPSPSIVAVEPVPATLSLAIRAPPRCHTSEEPLPCLPHHPLLLARRSHRSAMATKVLVFYI
jgi:hypothetical protein